MKYPAVSQMRCRFARRRRPFAYRKQSPTGVESPRYRFPADNLGIPLLIKNGHYFPPPRQQPAAASVRLFAAIIFAATVAPFLRAEFGVAAAFQTHPPPNVHALPPPR
ncbi:hypothetical protein KCP69_20885 [Salmonella enterica subsp. enterica]|nr:hypothetical protein KCP69_20885 [Salmonella enterica subsp. enterica]